MVFSGESGGEEGGGREGGGREGGGGEDVGGEEGEWLGWAGGVGCGKGSLEDWECERVGEGRRGGADGSMD